MAESWTVAFTDVGFTANRNMGAILNNHASEVLRIRRVGLLNSQTANVATHTLAQIECRRLTGASLTGETPVVPTPHDTNNVSPLSAVYGTLGTMGGTSACFRRVYWSTGNPLPNAEAVADEMETFVPSNIIWGIDSGDEVIVLRQDEMYVTYTGHGLGATGGLLDSWVEFTKDA